jgi:hypothetical protein
MEDALRFGDVLVLRDIETALNWIFFRPADDFLAAVGILLAAVDTDLEWVRAYSRLLVRAREWDAKLATPALRSAEVT